MKRIRLQLLAARSEILVGSGTYRNLRSHLRAVGLRPPFIVVSQPKILQHVSPPRLNDMSLVVIPDGERAKSFSTVRKLVDKMLELSLTREATVVALGGGVVGDVAGFVASIYLRGIAVVQVPTTLLAQVDSSVGGKTGINHRVGKNLVGTFHQPRLVVADPELLRSLSAREYRSGLYEALKYGVIRDPVLFERFESRRRQILDRDPAVLEELVHRCLRIKASVVSEDEKEGGVRRVLNFGHTLGHAIETAAGYRRIRHGEAVGHGMVGATRISRELRRISGTEASRIERALDSLGPRPSIASLPISAIMEAMRHDKKVRSGTLHFVLPERVGKVRIEAGIAPKLVRTVIQGLS